MDLMVALETVVALLVRLASFLVGALEFWKDAASTLGVFKSFLVFVAVECVLVGLGVSLDASRAFAGLFESG